MSDQQGSAGQSPAKPTSRRHHLVPAFYLAAFTDTGRRDGLVTVTNLAQRKWYRGKPDSVGYRKKINTLTSVDADPDAVERLYAEVERLAAPAVARVLDSEVPPKGDDLHAICLLMAAQVARDLRHRESIMQFTSEVYESMLRAVTSSPEIFASCSTRLREEKGIDLGDYEQFRKSVQRSKVIVQDNDWIKAMALDGLETVAATMVDRSWDVMRVPEDADYCFITSDRPLKLRWTLPELTHGPYPPGFALENTRVTFPLSPRLMLFGEFGIPDGLVLPADESLAAMFNSNTAYGSSELFSPSNDFLWADESGIHRGADLLLDTLLADEAQG